MFDQYFGDELLHGEKTIKVNFRDYKLFGVYFSASWCPPCRQFTPQLAQLYREKNAENKQFEVVFVSHDNDEKEFEEYYTKMPWLAIPYSARFRIQLMNKLVRPQSIPYLCIFDQQGTYITCNAREDLARMGHAAFEHWQAKAKN